MSQNSLSVIVPTLNESGNLPQLVIRIHDSLASAGIVYEIIIVDDHSTDTTEKVALELAKCFPVRFYKKLGKKGKAQSLLEGFSYAGFGTLGMIDGDLQYPPEVFPEMLQLVREGNDVVVADRVS